ncbi:hypothetical protein Tco_0049744, partial [Tanacetum coccineum]
SSISNWKIPFGRWEGIDFHGIHSRVEIAFFLGKTIRVGSLIGAVNCNQICNILV